MCGLARDDAQRQRIPAAESDQLVDRGRVGIEPGLAEAVGQQRAGFDVGEHVEQQLPGPVPGDQTRQPLSARHHDSAGRGPRQQRFDLGGGGGVVQEEEHPLVRDQAAKQRGLRVQGRRDPRRRHAQCVEKPPHRHFGGHRLVRRAEPAKVDEEPAVRELVGVAVRPAQCQPGLADPAGARDRRDHHGGGRTRRGQPTVQVGQIRTAADERRRRGGKLPRQNRLTRRPRRVGHRCRRRVGGQDLPVHFLERGGGVRTQLVDEEAADQLVVLQCLGAASGLVQRQHVLARGSFVERVLPGMGRERDHQFLPDPAPELGVHEVLPGDQPLLLEPLAFGFGPFPAHPGQRLSPPQPQCFGEQRQGSLVVAPGVRAELAGQVHVDGGQLRVGHQGVATGTAREADPVGIGHRRAQPGDVPVQGGPRPRRDIGTPDAPDQPVGRHHAARFEPEHRHDASLARRAEIHRPPVDQHVHLAQQTHHRDHVLPPPNTAGNDGSPK